MGLINFMVEMDTEKNIVENFSKEMFKKLSLRHDRYVPMSWNSLDMKRLLWLLQGELSEINKTLNEPETNNDMLNQLDSPIKRSNMKDNALDIANYSMFIYELLK